MYIIHHIIAEERNSSCGAGEEGQHCSLTRSHEYYQWVALALTAQAVAAYLPGWLWRGWEGGSLAAVVGDSGLKALDDILAETSEQCGARADTVADKVVSLAGTHNKWAACFLLCEILNFVVTIGQIFFTDFFLGGFFISYGLDMINHVVEKDFEDENPMEKVLFNKSLHEVDQYR